MYAMISDLQSLQNGTLSPTFFRRSYVSKRVSNLELSKSGAMAREFAKGVNCLDIEGIEDKYMLAGCNNGRLYLHVLSVVPNSPVDETIQTVFGDDRRHSHQCSLDTVQWYPFDAGLFVTSGMDHKVKVWDSTEFTPVDNFLMPSRVYEHHMSTIATHHSLIAVAMNHPQTILIDMRTGSQCHHLQAHKGKVMSVKWSPFSEHLLATGGADNKLLLWDIRSAKGFLKALDQHNGEALSSQKDLVSAHGGMINGLCFSSDGLYLVSFGTDNRVRLWDVALGKNTLVNYGTVINKCRKRVQIDLCYDVTIPVVFIPSQTRILVYDMFTGTKYNTLVGHMSATKCCTFRNQYHELYSGGNDRQIVMWTPSDANDLSKQDIPFVQSRLRDAWSDDDDDDEDENSL